jgi:hypothetical protein
MLLDLDIDELLMGFCKTLFNTANNCDGWAGFLQNSDIEK